MTAVGSKSTFQPLPQIDLLHAHHVTQSPDLYLHTFAFEIVPHASDIGTQNKFLYICICFSLYAAFLVQLPSCSTVGCSQGHKVVWHKTMFSVIIEFAILLDASCLDYNLIIYLIII